MARADGGRAHGRLTVVGDSVMLEPHVVLESAIDARTSAILDRFPLHLVGWRPRTMIVPDSLSWADGHLRAEFRVADVEGATTLACRWPGQGLPGGTRLACHSPYDVVEAFGPDGEKIFRRRASSLLAEALADASAAERDDVGRRFLDLGVQYVGRTFTSTTREGAFGRLSAHPTLTRALRDVPEDLEAWLLLIELDPEPQAVRGDESAATELVELTANALVEYFRPPLNRTSDVALTSSTETGSVRSEEHDAVALRIVTDRVGARLFSKVAAPAFAHSVVHPAASGEGSRLPGIGDDIEIDPGP